MDRRDLDVLFDALADAHRRRVCRVIADGEGFAVTLEELAGSADAAEDVEPAPSTAEGGDRRDGAAGLHHVHLPKLRDASIVEYDCERRTVRTDGAFPVAMELVRLVEEADEGT